MHLSSLTQLCCVQHRAAQSRALDAAALHDVSSCTEVALRTFLIQVKKWGISIVTGCAVAVSTFSEGSSILSAGSAVSDTEQHGDVQQMQQRFPIMSSSIHLKRLVCAQPQCWQPRSCALQLYSMLDHGHLSSSLHPALAAHMTP